MTPVRLEPAALRSRVKHSTTEPLRFLSEYTRSRQNKAILYILNKVTFFYSRIKKQSVYEFKCATYGTYEFTRGGGSRISGFIFLKSGGSLCWFYFFFLKYPMKMK